MADSIDIYVNQTGFQITPWDFSLSFGLLPVKRVAEAGSQAPVETAEEEFVVEDIGVIRMSHQHAKIVTILMRRALKSWEEREGEIKIADSLMERHQISGNEW